MKWTFAIKFFEVPFVLWCCVVTNAQNRGNHKELVYFITKYLYGSCNTYSTNNILFYIYYILYYCIKPVFHLAKLFARSEAKNKFRRCDWSAKKFTAKMLDQILHFYHSPSGKRA